MNIGRESALNNEGPRRLGELTMLAIISAGNIAASNGMLLQFLAVILCAGLLNVLYALSSVLAQLRIDR